MPHIDTRGSATLHLTDDEYHALRERVERDHPNSELARVLAEAQASEVPHTEPVVERVPHPMEDRRAEFPDGIESVVGQVAYPYAITVPMGEQDVAAAALRAEGHNEPATTVAENDPEVIA